jgi:hypothetical protein
MQYLDRLLIGLLAAKYAKHLMAMLLKNDAQIAALMVLLSRGVNGWREKGEKGRNVENGCTSSYQPIGTKKHALNAYYTHIKQIYTIDDGPAAVESDYTREKGEKGRKVENDCTSSYQPIGTKRRA